MAMFQALVDRLRDWPQRRIADPDFRLRAERHWLMRPIARRQAAALFDLVAGFVYSQVLRACVELELFDRLAEGAQSAPDLARACALPLDRARRLFDAAVALKLLRVTRDERYALGPRGAAMVGNPAVAAMVRHHDALYADLADPVALLRGRNGPGALAAFWPYATTPADTQALPADAVARYSALMSASQPLVAAQVLDAYDLGQHRTLLDVGGGEGRFLAAAGHRHPRLQLKLMDLPAVVERARWRLAADGLSARCECTGGDFRRDPLPTGADVITLVRVVHDHDDEVVRGLLAAAFHALPAGGTLLVAEPMADTGGARAMGDAYFGWYLMAMGSGRPRSAAELQRLMHEAGFRSMRRIPTRVPLQCGLLVARRP
jgi:demethylspheroidene O-methyltransferase